MGVAGPGGGGDPVVAHDASRAVEHIPLVGNQLQMQLCHPPLTGGLWKRLLAPARSHWGKKLKGEEKKSPEGRLY